MHIASARPHLRARDGERVRGGRRLRGTHHHRIRHMHMPAYANTHRQARAVAFAYAHDRVREYHIAMRVRALDLPDRILECISPCARLRRRHRDQQREKDGVVAAADAVSYERAVVVEAHHAPAAAYGICICRMGRPGREKRIAASAHGDMNMPHGSALTGETNRVSHAPVAHTAVRGARRAHDEARRTPLLGRDSDRVGIMARPEGADTRRARGRGGGAERESRANLGPRRQLRWRLRAHGRTREHTGVRRHHVPARMRIRICRMGGPYGKCVCACARRTRAAPRPRRRPHGTRPPGPKSRAATPPPRGHCPPAAHGVMHTSHGRVPYGNCVSQTAPTSAATKVPTAATCEKALPCAPARLMRRRICTFARARVRTESHRPTPRRQRPAWNMSHTERETARGGKESIRQTARPRSGSRSESLPANKTGLPVQKWKSGYFQHIAGALPRSPSAFHGAALRRVRRRSSDLTHLR